MLKCLLQCHDEIRVLSGASCQKMAHSVAMLGKNGLGETARLQRRARDASAPDGFLLTVLVLCPGGHLEALRQRCGIHHKV